MQAQQIRITYKKTLLIKQLNFLLEQITDNTKTLIEDPYYKSLLEQIETNKKELVYHLIHNLTKINRLYRIETNQKTLISTEEDILVALDLTKELINPSSILEPKDREYLRLLEAHFITKTFKAREASALFQLKKTQTWRILVKLIIAGILQRNGNPNKGYIYQFPIDPIELPILD
ncbi:hypothetical protein ETU08_00445 [Apibacter muscae]|uniref:hypothetical protein n=1 Tax=Apibacter muscae TaxID=2509004 RepID=UPI0011ACEA6A|nr:hypothetical protein [Apibacter muscae]TWP31709.1 hypothetical protein ETU08_00445 [Apibacter muscae]